MITVVLVHPDDVNLADTKALAARQGATVVASRYVLRGHVIVTNHAVTTFETPEPE